MATIGWATLDVVPSLRNAQGSLERQSRGPLTAAGRTGGRQYGDAAGKQAGSSFKDRFQKGLKGLAGPLTAAFAGLGVKKVLTDSVKAFQDLNLQVVQFRRLTGGSVEAASRLRTAVQLSGVDITKATASLTIFSKNLGKAAVDGEKTAAMTEALGTSFVNADGSIRGLTELLPEVADQFAAMEDGVAKTTLATKLFGRAGTAMLPFLNKGSEGIAALAAQSDKLGLTLNQADLDSFGEYRTASRELQASLQGLKVALGRDVLPALTSLTTYATQTGIPALRSVTGVAKDIYGAYKALPQPIEDAVKAFLLLRLASAVGLTAALTAAPAAAASAYFALRSRIAATTAGLAGLRAAGAAAGATFTALSRVALPIAAVTIAISAFTRFKQAQAESKERVDALTASLDKQTGALTAASAEAVAAALASDGGNSGFSAKIAAEELGIAFEDLTQAALGNEAAIARVNAAVANTDGSLAQKFAADKVTESLAAQGTELGRSRQAFADQKAVTEAAATATEEMGVATDGSTGKIKIYKSELDNARTALRKLITIEKERKDALLADRQDALALDEQIRNARKQGRKGEDAGINTRTAVGAENRGALYDLIEQFNNSTPKVRNAEGAFARVRQEVLDLGEQMGGGKRQLEGLVDELLRVPKSAPLKFQTEGFRQSMAQIEAERLALLALSELAIVRINLGPAPDTLGIPYGRGGQTPATVPAGPPSRDRDRADDSGRTVYQYNGPVTYTDDEQGRRRARNMDRRAGGDGVRRP